jgi:hypothetical protein
VASVTASGLTSNAEHEMYYQHMKQVKEQNIPSLPSEQVEASSNSGSYVIAVYNSTQCTADSVYTASGYVFDHCISLGSSGGFKYSDCKSGGGVTTVTMTSCTASDCGSGCASYPIPLATGCQTSSMFTCSSSSEPWKDYNMNTYSLLYWGNTDCSSGNGFDQWVTVDAAEGACDDLSCYSNSTNGADFSIEYHCN